MHVAVDAHGRIAISSIRDRTVALRARNLNTQAGLAHVLGIRLQGLQLMGTGLFWGEFQRATGRYGQKASVLW